MAPWLSTLPVLPPCTSTPTVLLTSVDVIEAPESIVMLLLLLRTTPAAFAFGVTVQPDSRVMSDPDVPDPDAGHAASATPAKASSGATATAVRRTLRINETL
jgi:hypothetical protein